MTPTASCYTDEALAARIVDAATELFRTYSVHGVSPSLVAAHLDVPTEAVVAAFPSWNGMVLVAFDRWAARQVHPLLPIAAEQGTVPFLRAVLVASTRDDWDFALTLVAHTDLPDHPLTPHLRTRWARFADFVHASLVRDVRVGRVAAGQDLAAVREALLTVVAGIQMRRSIAPGLDVGREFDRIIAAGG